MISKPLFWPALFAAYFAAQMVMRLAIGPALELDEAEAFYFARNLAIGYNAQPPLYFWLQWVLFQIFGEGLFAMALLKALLLTTALVVLYRLLLTALPVPVAGIAATSLSLLPQIVWEAQRALTHSVLVLTMAVILYAVAWLVLTRGRWRDHLLLGVTIGLGLLSKYNFALLPFGLWAAALMVPEWRARLQPARLVVSLVIAAIIVLPVAIWSLQNPDVAGGSVHKLGLEATGPVMARVIGAGAFVAGLAAFLALPLILLGPLWLLRNRAAKVAWSPPLRFLFLGAVSSLGLLLVSLLIAGGTEVKDRWLLPLAWPLVPAAVALLWPLLAATQRRILGGCVLGLWLLAVPLLPYASLRDPGYRAADFITFIETVEQTAPGTTVIASNTTYILGNLAYLDPSLTLGGTETFPDSAFVLIVDADSDLDPGPRAGASIAYDMRHGNGSRSFRITPMAAN